MSTARPESEEALAESLAAAPFVRVVAAADGDSLAAAGLLARACRSTGIPFQVRVDDAFDDAEDALTVSTGPVAVETDRALTGRPVSPYAYEVARALGTDPDPVLALAGTVAAGETPQAADEPLQVAEGAERIRRRPGVAVPTTDLADGLAATTLLFAPFSGDRESAAALVADLGIDSVSDDADEAGNADGADATQFDEAVNRRLASLVALETVGADDATPRAAEQVERALRPYETPAAPFATLGGYADVLDAVAREAPGVGVALALGGVSESAPLREAALDAWRRHAAATHRLLRGAEVARHRGLAVARVDDDHPSALPTVARLFRDFRSPEGTVLVVCDGAAAAASVDPDAVGETVATAASAVDGTGHGTPTTGTARFDTDAAQFVTAYREAR